jgi:hypothetical protein
MIEKPPRAWLGGHWLQVVASILLLACGSGPVAVEAKEGDPCHLCNDATCGDPSVNNTCDCEKCPGRAFDNAAKTLLICAQGTWTVGQKCPGGGSVTCRDHEPVDPHCLDADRTELPIK